MLAKKKYDITIIGSGLSGLSLALKLANKGFTIAVLSKRELTEGSTLYAQGGIAAVLNDKVDSFESHINDTFNAGTHICKESAVSYVVNNGPSAIKWLVDQGVEFTHLDESSKLRITSHHNHGIHEDLIDHENIWSQYHLTKEGGHSHRRIIHAADATGFSVETTLSENVRQHSQIDILENYIAIDFIIDEKDDEKSCIGMYVLDNKTKNVHSLTSRYFILATGGAAKVYLYSSNPDTATGDGIAMAWRAGCRVANMEFMQFHPTCLYHPQAKSFLISEALRGEGARLKLPNGKAFMHLYDDRQELAPRDIVARAIDSEMKKGGFDHVFLDISHQDEDFIKTHFPTIYGQCLKFGIDITKDMIPVVPAAHYTCGGIMIDNRARSDIHNLYAIGECTYSGLHGANRLASNSLLECVVYAHAAFEDIMARTQHDDDKTLMVDLPQWDDSRVSDADEMVVVSHNWDELRRTMWDYVGIVRTNKRLKRAHNRVQLLHDEVQEFYGNFKVTHDLLELRNLILIADLIIQSAIHRKESRGLHFTRDYPATDDIKFNKATIITPQNHQDKRI